MTAILHPKPSIDLKSVAGLMMGVSDMATRELGLAADPLFLEQAAKVNLGIFSLVVMGEVKKGKSSFINALCGHRELVPTHDDVATSTIYKIRASPAIRYTVFFQETAVDPATGKPREKKQIEPAEIPRYGTETGNPGNREKVNFIAVEAPSPLLGSGVVIIDTPGIGGLVTEHKAITFRHAPRADGIFFVTDSIESPLGDVEVAFLKDLRRITQKIYFVQTKADLVETSAAVARMKNNISILTSSAGFTEDEIRYFIVSSSLKLSGDEHRTMEDLEDSGFIPLIRVLNLELKSELDRSIASVALSRTRIKIAAAVPEIVWRRKALDATSEEKRTELGAELTTFKEGLHDWEMAKLPTIKKQFGQSLASALDAAQFQLSRSFGAGGTISRGIANQLDDLDAPDVIYACSYELFENARAEASFKLLDTCRELEGRLKEMIIEFEEKVRSAVNGYTGDESARDRIHSDSHPELEYSGDRAASRLIGKKGQVGPLEYIQRGMFGGTGAATIGGGAATVALYFVPVVGQVAAAITAAVTAVAYVKGAFRAARNLKVQQADAARKEVRGEIDRELSDLHSQACAELRTLSNTLRAQADEAVTGIVAAASRALEVRRQLLDKRQRETAEEIAAQTKIQKALEEKAAQFVAKLETLEQLANS
jgi:GTP-binding protein EngB required for normal cell division